MASDRPDFGLRFAELRRLSHLGPLSLVIREEPDVRSALALLIRHEHMDNEALHTRIREDNGIAVIAVELDAPDVDITRAVGRSGRRTAHVSG